MKLQDQIIREIFKNGGPCRAVALPKVTQIERVRSTPKACPALAQEHARIIATWNQN